MEINLFVGHPSYIWGYQKFGNRHWSNILYKSLLFYNFTLDVKYVINFYYYTYKNKNKIAIIDYQYYSSYSNLKVLLFFIKYMRSEKRSNKQFSTDSILYITNNINKRLTFKLSFKFKWLTVFYGSYMLSSVN